MSFLDSVRRAAENCRKIAGPQGLGVRLNRLTVRTRTWSGDRVGLGTTTDVDLELPGHYPVRSISSQEIFSSGGRYEVGDILVDHITPRESEDSDVGFTAEQLQPTVTVDNVEIIYVITGSHPGEYTCTDLNNYRPFTSKLVLRKRA